MGITRQFFESQRRRRFGTANPERMPLAFWEWMVRRSEDARLRHWSADRDPSVLGHTPYQVRAFFGHYGDYSMALAVDIKEGVEADTGRPCVLERYWKGRQHRHPARPPH